MLASEPGKREVGQRSPEGMLVFSSDFPHPEGTKSPRQIFDDLLSDASEREREQFFGGSLAELTGF